jgi:hypothetical protein
MTSSPQDEPSDPDVEDGVIPTFICRCHPRHLLRFVPNDKDTRGHLHD